MIFFETNVKICDSENEQTAAMYSTRNETYYAFKIERLQKRYSILTTLISILKCFLVEMKCHKKPSLLKYLFLFKVFDGNFLKLFNSFFVSYCRIYELVERVKSIVCAIKKNQTLFKTTVYLCELFFLHLFHHCVNVSKQH